jgi:hypothetical protein
MLTPYDLTYGSGKRDWWKCKSCEHSWITSLNNRVKGHSCPKCKCGRISPISQEWLDLVGIKKENREIKLPNLNLYVDGFDPLTNTVYEFLGDYWHGNPVKYKPDLINQNNKKRFGNLYLKWLSKKHLLETNGYTVIFMWENDFIRR